MSTNTSTEIYTRIFNDELFNKTIESLTFSQFLTSHQYKNNTLIDYSTLKKCVWLASILAKSDNENHRRKVQIFAMLSYLVFKNNLEIERATFLLLSRIGNLPATKHLASFRGLEIKDNNIGASSDYYDAVLDYELATEINDKTISFQENSVLLTSFQNQLWQKLNQHSNLSISAPTSAGKSFIIKRFINEIQTNLVNQNYIYIVPSRALINQVSEEFRKEIGEQVEVFTSFIEENEPNNERNHLYILTPERCLKLIQFARNNSLKVNLIFVDEIQNIEDEKGRGTLLEFVLKELSILFYEAQVIIAGPNIKNSQQLFTNIFNLKSIPVTTELSPVFQIKTIIRPLENDSLLIIIKALPNRSIIYTLNSGINIQKAFNASVGNGLAELINYFSLNQSSIIFSSRSDYAELWARKSIEKSKAENIITNETKELIEFLEDEVHPSYYLIDCLKLRIAFHHSKLPDLVRKEIEDGFIDGRIAKLFCTSTLIEGVNLPANNLFIVSPKILGEKLSPFRFGNLIGRAGRLKDSMYGTIYCIEKNRNDEWAEEFLDQGFEKIVESASDKAINDYHNFQDQVLLSVKDIKQKKDQNTVILLRLKFMKNAEDLSDYLKTKKIPQISIDTIVKNISTSLEDVLIPYETAQKNPSIDPILQNELYNSILKDGIERWCIHINKNFEARIRAEDIYGPYNEWSFFWQLADILERLDKIFGIWREVNIDHQINISLKQMSSYAVRWTTGESYRKLIQEDLNFMARHIDPEKRIDKSNKEHINKRINIVIKINTTVVSHVLVKYTKLLNDILEPLMSDEDKNKFKFNLALPTMLELGTRSPSVHLLISRGVTRSVAMKVFKLFEKVVGHEELNIIEWLQQQEQLNLKPIYKRYLKNLKLVPALSHS